ncbi:acyl-CoA thioesterase [Pokkaliibacter sp. MBI-7]|uniref:acyl-CoA thioesterase n=1 Tax=Pokkaliibacter sp. MBI-7 TaxID=3040600 RepID=UPI00244982B9|nr:acyl-CoA thioesterase [Pokkaliibacter sp. MBI-7]MDH2433204.1 acyl-CoA thioesterase [Pokkaliibacter sp. MBI-7]
MLDSEESNPLPQGELSLQFPASISDTNSYGDIFGGWLVKHMDTAAAVHAGRLAHGRIATVSISQVEFLSPVLVGTLLSFYTRTVETGKSSMKIAVEVWAQCPDGTEFRKITEGLFVLVAINDEGHIRPLPTAYQRLGR